MRGCAIRAESDVRSSSNGTHATRLISGVDDRRRISRQASKRRAGFAGRGAKDRFSEGARHVCGPDSATPDDRRDSLPRPAPQPSPERTDRSRARKNDGALLAVGGAPQKSPCLPRRESDGIGRPCALRIPATGDSHPQTRGGPGRAPAPTEARGGTGNAGGRRQPKRVDAVSGD